MSSKVEAKKGRGRPAKTDGVKVGVADAVSPKTHMDAIMRHAKMLHKMAKMK
ncbi:MAG TPA: hypothetical protein VNW29_01555 [Candidatus Sulfotelmatobacter sp.]|nr:hypothetical protein [Candidatus Sulfotelmatobacter sp.]